MIADPSRDHNDRAHLVKMKVALGQYVTFVKLGKVLRIRKFPLDVEETVVRVTEISMCCRCNTSLVTGMKSFKTQQCAHVLCSSCVEDKSVDWCPSCHSCILKMSDAERAEAAGHLEKRKAQYLALWKHDRFLPIWLLRAEWYHAGMYMFSKGHITRRMLNLVPMKMQPAKVTLFDPFVWIAVIMFNVFPTTQDFLLDIKAI